MGAGVLLVSPTGQLRKYSIQLAFPREGCARRTAECEALLASLRIAAEMGISHLSVRHDSQLMIGQVERTELSPLVKAYAGEMRKLEFCFQSIKLEHVPRGQDAAVKELSRIAAKGLLVPFEVAIEKLSQPSAIPEEEDPEILPASE
jgi:ribonuclease HI